MEEGYILIHRKILESLVWTNTKALKIFLYCIFRANHKDADVFMGRKKVQLKRGQFISSYPHMAEDLGLAMSTVYYWFDVLEAERMIERSRGGSFTTVTVTNYDKYQNVERILERRKKGQRKVEETDNTLKHEKHINTYSSEFTEFIGWYNSTFGKNFTPTVNRRKQYAVRRKTYSEEDIRRAFTNLSESAYHLGDNKDGRFYATPEFLLRNDEQIDKWRDEKNIWGGGA